MGKKVLILQDELSAYNVDVYNILANHYDLTVGFYQEDKANKDCLFSKNILRAGSKSPFTIIKGLRKYCKVLSLICFAPNMHVLCYCMLPFLPHKYIKHQLEYRFPRFIRASIHILAKHIVADKVFETILNKCNSTIFYMEKSKEFWKGTSLNMDKVFVAPNTTAVTKIDVDPSMKKDFLFVGTLYKGKGLDLLVKAYRQAIDKCSKSIPNLRIVGDGEMQ